MMFRALASGSTTPATPIGLSTTWPSSSSMVGCTAARATNNVVAATVSQAPGRQAGDGGCPSGNSRGVNTSASATVGYQAQPENQPASSPPGSRAVRHGGAGD